MAYESMLLEVPDVAEALSEITADGKEITSALYLTDSQQVLLITRTPVRKSTFRPMQKDDEEEEE